MRPLRRFIAGAQALLQRRRTDDELDEELQAYLDAAIEAGERSGLSPEDATRTARARMGSLLAVRAETRDVGWEVWIEHIWRDVRHAARTLRKAPVFTVVAVLMLALGIGANTAIFSAVNAVVLRRLPVSQPSELVAIAAAYPEGVEPVFSYEAFRTIQADASSLVDVVAASNSRRDAIALDGPPEPADVKWVSGNYFATLGVPAARGRTFSSRRAAVGAADAVAVISDAYWTRRFGRSESVIGRSFRLKSTTFTIVGVARRGFTGESPGEAVDVWMPLELLAQAPASHWVGHSTTWLRLLARRRAGVSFEQARSGLEPVYRQVRDAIAADTESPEYRASVQRSRLIVTDASRGSSRLREYFATPLVILMGLVGLVLLVACANLANLMLARAAIRRRESAVCLALGVSRRRLAWQRLVEALLLALAGGAGGVLLATWALPALASSLSGILPVALDLSPDVSVLVFASVLSVATALAFGLWPALRVARIDPLPALKAGGQAGRDRRPLGRMLVVIQVAMSIVLLVGAGLFVRSLMALQGIDTGFDPDRVALVRLAPAAAASSLTAEHRQALLEQMIARAGRVPGVTRVSASVNGVFSRGTWRNTISVDGVVPVAGPTPRAYVDAVTSGYFDAMRIAVLRGRGFTDADRAGGPRSAVVNQAFVRRFFASTDPVGRHVSLCTSDPCGEVPAERRMEIAGVVEDAKLVELREEPLPTIYVPLTQVERMPAEIQVLTATGPAAVSTALHRALTSGDTRLTVVAMTDARTQVNASIAAERLVATLSAAFGAFALLLAAIGLYGLVACVTVQRTGEIGIRMALGASRGHVRRLVLQDTLALLIVGSAIGLPIAYGLARLLDGQLYGVSTGDPMAFAVGLAALSFAALLAGYLPARRATRVDPVRALRAD